MLKIKNVLVLLFLVMTVSVFAATDNADLDLTGFIGEVVDVTITPEAVASSIDLTVDHTNLLVATANEFCNVAAGYTVSLEALNGEFVNTTDGSQTLDYLISYGALSDTNLAAATAVTGTDTVSNTPAAGVDVPVHLTHTAATTQTDGTYTETITFTITNK